MKPTPNLRAYFNPATKKLLLLSILLYVLLWIGYKACFPMADFFVDSNNYVLAAKEGMVVFYRPIAYSDFLVWLHKINTSAGFVVSVQYGFLALSSLALFFSIDYLYGFSRPWIRKLSWLLLTIQPILLPVANQVASDSLFTALTIGWFTSLLWIIRKPGWGVLVLQVLLLYWAFLVRYSGLYYPVLSLVAFLLANGKSGLFRIAGILASCVVIVYGYKSIKQVNQKTTGAETFAGFSGWQLANNALYMYPFISVKSDDFEDPEMRVLDQAVKIYYDSIEATELKLIKTEHKVGHAVFLWDKNSPLKRYLYYYVHKNHVDYFPAWQTVSVMYGDYAKQLILDHPKAFTRYYLYPNIKNLLVPERECLKGFDETYTVADCSKEWFGIKNVKARPLYPGLKGLLVSPYPYVNTLLLLLSLILPVLLLLQWHRQTGQWKSPHLPLLLFWGAYFGIGAAFTVLASVVVLRYQLPFLTIALALCPWMIDQLLPKRQHQ